MLDLPPEVWRYIFACWGAMALGALAGCLTRWRRNKRAAERERAGWEEVSL